jgi:phosphoglycolate phosphatase-like HAD superfamily hydrolase
VVLGCDDVKQKKPDPEIINKALSTMKIDKQKAIIIGDSSIDIESANNACISSCFVTYGIGKLKNAKPQFTVSDIRDIVNIVYKE